MHARSPRESPNESSGGGGACCRGCDDGAWCTTTGTARAGLAESLVSVRAFFADFSSASRTLLAPAPAPAVLPAPLPSVSRSPRDSLSAVASPLAALAFLGSLVSLALPSLPPLLLLFLAAPAPADDVLAALPRAPPAARRSGASVPRALAGPCSPAKISSSSDMESAICEIQP